MIKYKTIIHHNTSLFDRDINEFTNKICVISVQFRTFVVYHKEYFVAFITYNIDYTNAS